MADTERQTDLDGRQPIDTLTDDSISAFCSDIKCKEGSATLDSVTGLCVCPKWTNEDVRYLPSSGARR
jgi:hypothetical protein